MNYHEAYQLVAAYQHERYIRIPHEVAEAVYVLHEHKHTYKQIAGMISGATFRTIEHLFVRAGKTKRRETPQLENRVIPQTVPVILDMPRPMSCVRCQGFIEDIQEFAYELSGERYFVMGYRCINCGWRSGKQEHGQVSTMTHVTMS